MKLSPLRDITELTDKKTSFVKYRNLNIGNIFSSLFITSIEHLIIKNCYSFAFEVFFGVLLQVTESHDIEIIKEHR